LILLYSAGAYFAWRWVRALSEFSHQAFATSRAELAADIALLKASYGYRN
jgi:hypothetical protein